MSLLAPTSQVCSWTQALDNPASLATYVANGGYQALRRVVTEQMPGDDQFNYSREYLMARLAVMLGGRTSEEIAIGDITTGAENDLIEASGLARRMITRWGMGAIGLMAVASNEEQPFLGYELSQARDFSEETGARIDRDLQRLLEERHAAARKILTDERDKLDKLVEALLHEETLAQEQLAVILGPRVFDADLEVEAQPELVPAHPA